MTRKGEAAVASGESVNEVVVGGRVQNSGHGEVFHLFAGWPLML